MRKIRIQAKKLEEASANFISLVNRGANRIPFFTHDLDDCGDSRNSQRPCGRCYHGVTLTGRAGAGICLAQRCANVVNLGIADAGELIVSRRRRAQAGGGPAQRRVDGKCKQRPPHPSSDSARARGLVDAHSHAARLLYVWCIESGQMRP